MHDEALLAKFERLTEITAEREGLDLQRAGLLALLEILARSVEPGDEPLELPASAIHDLTIALQDDEVRRRARFAIEFAHEDEHVAALRRVLTAVAEAQRVPPPGVLLAIASCCEVMGDLAELRDAAGAVLMLQPDDVEAHELLGGLELLRGDAPRARRHLDAAGRPPWGWAALADSIDRGRATKVGRNDPCPCESGQRFKRCCASSGGLSLPMRVDLLPLRIDEWLDRLPLRRRLVPLACVAAGLEVLEDDLDRVLEGTSSPILRALYLFEGGGMARLVREVSPALQADEGAVIVTWPEARHRVWTIGRPDVRRSFHLTDASTGEVVVAMGIAADVLDADVDHLVGVAVPIPRPADHEPSHRLWPGHVALDDDEAARTRALLEGTIDVDQLVREIAAPTMAVWAAMAQAARATTPEVLERAAWLLGADLAAHLEGNLDLLDDLVTVTFMEGGGFSDVADLLRDGARRIVCAEPPEVWDAALRLAAIGVERGDIVLEVAMAWEVARRQTRRRPDARGEQFVRLLAAMPAQRFVP